MSLTRSLLAILIISRLNLVVGRIQLRSTVRSLRAEASPAKASGAAWRQAKRQSADGRSLCVGGKLIPEVYVLGAPKSATTTIAVNLKATGVRNVHGKFNDKELHWFDGHMAWQYRGQKGREHERERWLDVMPACPVNGSARTLLADFTPDYLRMVPLPDEFKPYGSLPPWNALINLGQTPPGGTDVVSLPPLLRSFYGEHAKELKFVVMMRDPLDRMQSAWYHSASFNFTNLCVDCRAPDFQTALREHMDLMRAGKISDWIWTGMYGRQLEEWLKVFEPKQFVLVPSSYLVKKGTAETICEDLSGAFQYAIDCKSSGVSLAHQWSHAHPLKEKDSSFVMREDFKDLMRTEKLRLARVLNLMHKKGAVLAGSRGAQLRSDADVYRWLSHGW